MTPIDLIRAAEILSDGVNPEAPLCWLLNRLPPTSRAHGYARSIDALQSLELADGLRCDFPAPRLFDHEAAAATWAGLLASSSLTEEDTKHASRFFEVDPNEFAPHVFPSRWAPQSWTSPLTPAQMRSTLMMSAEDTSETIAIVKALAAAAKPMPAIFRLPGHNYDELAAAKLRVGVTPYADTLVFSALFYAVSDCVEGMTFLPASFYRVKGPQARSVPIESAVCNAGYTTRFQFERIASHMPAYQHQIFNEGLTRSIVLKLRPDRRKLPQVSHLSLLGQFGPQGNCLTESTFTEEGITRLSIDDDFAIAEAVDPMINWEQALLLSFAGKLNGLQRDGGGRNDGLGLSLSTDGHLWGAHFHLFRPGEIGDENDLPTQPGASALIRAAWNPASQRGAPREDVEAQLSWFMPQVDNDFRTAKLARDLATIADRVFVHTIESALGVLHNQTHASSPSADAARSALSRVGRALLTPLFATLPEYRGAMLDSPPECWLAKVIGPADHLAYRPRWHRRLELQERAGIPESVLRNLKLAS